MNKQMGKDIQNPQPDNVLSYNGKQTSFIKKNTLVVILICIFIVGCMASPVFFRGNNIQNILINVSIYGVLAIGQTMVMLVKEIDLSIGAIMAFAPMTSVFITRAIMLSMGTEIIKGGNYVTSGMLLLIVLTIIISVLIGLLNGFIRVKAKVPSLITTLGMMYALGGLAYVFSGGYSLYLTRLEGINWLGTHKFLSIPVSFLIFLAIGIVTIIIIRYTKVGRRIYATGGNEKAALYSGVNTNLWKIIAFGFSGFCAGISALIYSSRLESIEPVQGNGYELIAIAVAVIGGTTLQGGRGTISGTLIASAILSIVLNIMSLIGLVAWYQTIILGCIIIGAAFQHSRAQQSRVF
jgi:ribose/xylose/arabinose/galactoside ABC-type transport system permease subunit